MFDTGGTGTVAEAEGPDGWWGPPSPDEVELIARLNAQAARADEHLLAFWDGDLDEDEAEWDVDPQVRMREPSEAELAASVTGEDLVARVQDADPGAVDDYTVVELFASWWRLVSWAQAGAARAAAELARRPSMTIPRAARAAGDEHGREVKSVSAAAHELAMRVMISRPAAQSLINVGKASDGPLWPVVDALRDGLIDLPRARAFVETLTPVPWQVAVAVQDHVLPTAPRRTARQVQQDLERALISVDPQDATARHQRARDRRRVCRPTLLPDGMAGIWAVLPAVDAVALDVALDGAARHARTNGDARTSDQLRADILASIGHNALATGWIGAPPVSGSTTEVARARSASHSSAGDGSAVGAGEGRSETGEGRGKAQDPDGAGKGFRVGTIGGRQAQIRVVVPLGVLAPAPDAEQGNTEQGITEPDRPDRGFSDPEPVAELDGYGPVTPEVARALALGGTWTRLITDPETDTVRSVGRRRYHPPAELAELVRARDKTCTRPGCSASARSCDLDHTVPYHLEGETAVWNLAALCPTDHALKTAGGVKIEQVGRGTFDFHLPSGHIYRRNPDGTSTIRQRHDDNAPPPF